MRRWLPWLAAALVAAALVHVAVLHLTPYVIMSLAMRRISGGAGVNTPTFAPRADATARAIVRPSPDLLYSVCVFDVSQRPLHVTAEVPRDTYWSISMFADNTDNFFKLNDREAAAPSVDLVLARAGSAPSLPPGARLVEAPSSRGIVLTRTLVAEEGRLADLDAARRSFRCGILE